MNRSLFAACSALLLWGNPSAAQSFTPAPEGHLLGGPLALSARGDLDGDGRSDWVSGTLGGGLTWRSTIDGPVHPVALDSRDWSAVAAVIADLDGDGDGDLVLSDPQAGRLTWVEQDAATGQWTERGIGRVRARALAAADLDGDGRAEVVTLDSAPRQGTVRLWRLNSSQRWPQEQIGRSHGATIAFADLAGDAALDIVLGGHWLEHPNAQDGAWRSRAFARPFALEARAVTTDIDLDGDLDVVSIELGCRGGELRWYENTGALQRALWPVHLLDTTGGCEDSLDVAQLDGVGAPELVLIGRDPLSGARARIYRGVESAANAPASVVHDVALPQHSLTLLLDADADGDLDLLSASHVVDRIRVGFNDLLSLTDGLVGHWEFDTGFGGTAFDSSGNGHDGVIQGAKWAKGVTGGALRFDGDDSVEVADAPALRISDDISIAAWVFKSAPNDAQRWEAIVAKAAGNAWDYELLTSMAQPDQPALYSDATGPTEVYAGIPLLSGEWKHVAVTRSGSTVRFFVDGSETAAVSMGGSFPSSSKPLLIGYDFLDGMIGRLDDVRLYDRALSAAEVGALSQREIAPSADIEQHP